MRLTAVLIAVVLLAGLLPPPGGAKAAPVLDQSYLQSNGTGLVSTALLFPDFRRAQTFTVGLSGTLVELDVAIDPESVVPGKSATLNLLATLGGTPTTILQTSPTVNTTLLAGFMDFVVSLPVSVGEVLAFELVDANSGYTMLGSLPGQYAGGADFIINTEFNVDNFTAFTGADADFRSFVDVGATAVPEPASLALLVTGLLGFAAASRVRATFGS